MNTSISVQEQARGQLIGALVGLARALEGKEPSSSAKKALADGLALSLPGSISDPGLLQDMARRIQEEKADAAPDCASCQSPCGRTADYSMEEMWQTEGPLREKKFLLLTSLCSVGSAASRAMLSGEPDEEVFGFLLDGLFLLGYAFEDNQLDAVLSRGAGAYLRCL